MLSQVSKLFFDLYVVTTHLFEKSYKWIKNSWLLAWNDIFNFLKNILNVVLSKQTGTIFGLVFLTAVILGGPSITSKLLPQLTRWQLKGFSGDGFNIYVNYPAYISSEDKGNFEVVVYNTDSHLLNNFRVNFIPQQGTLIFDKANLVAIDTLQIGETKAVTLPFHIIRHQTDLDESIVLQGNFYSENQVTWHSNHPLVLKNSRLRKWMVQFKKIPETLDALAKYIGYLSSFFAGVLLFSGKIKPLISFISNLIKKEALESGKE